VVADSGIAGRRMALVMGLQMIFVATFPAEVRKCESRRKAKVQLAPVTGKSFLTGWDLSSI
jgi:hypothetical protein